MSNNATSDDFIRAMNRIQGDVHRLAVEQGWWKEEDLAIVRGEVGTPEERCRIVLEKLALIHSEVSEALEDARKGKFLFYLDENSKPCGFPSELADVVIRVLDLAGAMGVEVGTNMAIKHAYNKKREKRHGGKLA